MESPNRAIRKSLATRGSFPTDEAAPKPIYADLPGDPEL